MKRQTEEAYELIGIEAGNHTELGTIGDEIVSVIIFEARFETKHLPFADGDKIYFTHDANFDNYYEEDASILEHLDS